MPGIASAASAVAAAAHRNNDPHFSDGTTSRIARLSSSNGFWSNHREDLTYNQLQKFWSELSHQARQKLLRIDKQTLFEQARKNMYCSRCHGLLLEGYMQIIIYGKSLQQEVLCNHNTCNRVRGLKKQNDSDICATGGHPDEIQDPSVHPWGGLTTTRNGMLTLLDCYLHTSSLKGLQNVFDSARARERERELLYPDACGGDGRGWVSQEMGGYGRVHGSRESCALHTARLSVETLVDFWSALGEETRQSLLKMKEEDFIERLMYRFDSKRFCRDCRRNVIREFKELKELKRIRRENRCTTWFCVADAAFQYQVSHDMIQADWHQTFGDTFGAYHHFEWAVGSGEGKSDVLEFENVGLNGRVQVKGLDLRAMNSCYITLRGWKLDGRCTELSVKAHALKGQQCVHCRLVVGDGFISITRGESIRRFFEHAEEAEEDEDDDSMDKDGNELDGEYSRPQKHAKSPELAREFLLDAATVIFKEQVEKAFREGTARQNAHSIFVCLSLKMLEERVHVACKEIITLEKQMKLLEEEEKEKREEEERKERKRTKERGKKLRRKERLREKEKDRGKRCSVPNQDGVPPDSAEETVSVNTENESNPVDKGDAASETEEAVAIMSLSSDIQDEHLLDDFFLSGAQMNSDCPDEDLAIAHDESGPSPVDHFNYPKQKFRKEVDAFTRWSDRRRFTVVSNNGNMVCKYEPKKQVNHFDYSRSSNGLNKQLKNNRSSLRNGGSKFGEKFNSDRYESHSCSCKPINDNKANDELQMSRLVRESKPNRKLEMAGDVSRHYYRHSQAEYAGDNCGRSRSSSNRDSSFSKKVWEPLESQKRHQQSNIDYGSSLKSSTLKGEATESDLCSESCTVSSCLEGIENSVQKCQGNKDVRDEITADFETEEKMDNGFVLTEKPLQYKEAREGHPASDLLTSSSSNSENCSSCLSEGDSITFSSNAQSTESSSSDSEDASQNSEGREPSACPQNGFPAYRDGIEKKDSTGGKEHAKGSFTTNVACTNSWENSPSKGHVNTENKVLHASIGIQPQSLPPVHNQNMRIPVFQSPVGYYHQGPVAWPTTPANGFIPVPHSNQYVFASPLGYGLSGNTHFTPYVPLQHLPHPMVSHSHVPAFHPVVHNNGINPKDYSLVPNLGVFRAAHTEANVGVFRAAHPEANVMRMPSVIKQPLETHAKAEDDKPEKCDKDKSVVEEDSFSLFHFGGPVALSTGFTSDPVSLKKEIGDGTCSKLTPGQAEGDEACSKNTSIEEYNLFAASNGIKFSFL